ncbi:hypothetical protein [Mycolicibacterium nivoides]|uniref:DUF3817 domain-containing protein n=1 Tax=Mycolicibacterium nivoides TaxID=2487344 RepID=A0ABW9L2Z2_9MYCO|nr:hypothetical protein [Mycolicibacterium nivoides]QRY43849.1 hypothetical protein JVX93_25575 [Mycolicibacterium boenickei]SEQ32002.1 hypothetical protein SAMN04488583_2320 [Mycobacterium sp. 88mf]SFF44651.1 hypothetical protein SAMN04488582_102656 [Mycobacterium sp. 455mf]
MTGLLRTLGVLSVLELVSVLVLLVNLATVHDEALAHVLGPAHGALYLAVAVIALFGRDLTARTRIGALIPVLSGPLTMVNVRREAKSA